MSLKNLFGKTITSYEDVAQDVESPDFIDEVVEKRETYLPPIDFSDPANFVFYGSAQLYYEAAIKRIYEDYPYDGSKAEQIDFEEKSSFLERWLFENKYPKTTGFVELGTTANTTSTPGGYAETTVPEYIEVHGGLHISSIATNLDEHLEYSARYDEANNRTQNFNCDFVNKGITIEFWMKKSSYSSVDKEVILDLWNGVARGSTGYSRVFLETFDDSGVKKMALTIASGSTSSTSAFTMGTTETDWNHYAFSVFEGSSIGTIRFYTNGAENGSTSLASPFTTLPGRLDGFIGAMQTEITTGKGSANSGKLSAELDEFRFWKVRRTSRQIKLNWFREIGGGANTDDNTSDLGVYLKFNEGITGNLVTDATVLDYSGRIANGQWTGYPGSSARSTQSAINLSGYTEKPSPIIYSTHSDVVALEAEMSLSGSDYDALRGQAFYRSLPNWLVEEDQEEGSENLRKVSQILSSYMDTLRVQIDSLNKLQDKQYVSASHKASPFASELLTNKGFMTSEMFLSSEVFETFANIDYTSNQFDLNIDEIKNLIYTNIYNNLENIYNSKGTERSIRNLIRCFGIDDELIKLNQYIDGGTQYLGDKYRTTSVKKKYISLNHADHLSATMHQSGTLTFISGASEASVAAFTMEADIVVPHKPKLGESGYFATPFLSASVMGFHEAMPTNPSNFTWWATNTGTAPATGAITLPSGPSTLTLSDYQGHTFTITDTSGLTKTYEFANGTGTGNVLTNGNIAINSVTNPGSTATRIALAINDSDGHNGSIIAAAVGRNVNLTQDVDGANGNTIVSTTLSASLLTVTSFTGGTSTFGEGRDLQVYLVRDSLESENAKFVVKNQAETIYAESDFVYDIYDNDHYNVALRIKPQTYPYAGNVTNTTPDYDIELYAVSHNFDELKEEVLVTTTVNNTTGSQYLQAPKRIYAAAHYENFTGSVFHRTDLEFGRVSAWLDYLPNSSIQEHNKDVMNYGNRKSIDGSTAFAIDDVEIPTMDLSILNWDFDTVTTSDSSGEFIIEDTTSGSSDTIYGWVDNIVRREHDGRGFNFPNSSNAFLENEFLYANKKQLPETSFNTNNVFIKGEQEINFGTDDDVSDNLFILEKSPAAIVSEEMLKLFSTTQEFSNLFGRHVDRYRIEYKDLARARQLFYQRVTTGLDFDKFFTYFKWIDQSISEMINQLIPASINFSRGVTDVIEPHILERDKYQRRIGLLQTVTSTETSMRGVQELNYNWRLGHAPVTGTIDNSKLTNSIWRMERQERTDIQNDERGQAAEFIRQVIIRQTDQEFTNPLVLSGSSGNYSGSVFATRRFSRPYSIGVDLNSSIHGGTNYVKSKDRDLIRSGIGLHSLMGPSGAPKNVVTFGAGTGYGLNVSESAKTQDLRGPNEKTRYDGFGLFGKFTSFQSTDYRPLTPELDYFSRRKVCTVLPANFMSSSVTTGYTSIISASFRPGVDIVNLHSDTTDITNEIPIQGPFTERHIGGHQMRHVALNSVGKFRNATSTVANDLDSQFSRPEGYRLVLGKNPLVSETGSLEPDADGAIGFVAPDYGIGTDGTFPDEDRMYAIFYREERAKRPLNIKNIQTTTSSVYHGNFQHQYEVFSTFGDQGYFLKRAGNLLPDAIATTMSETTNYATLVAQDVGVQGNIALNEPAGDPSNRLVNANTTPTQDRSTGSAHVIRTRFSAPGGPEVNSPAYLDVATQQFSVYNSMNFRNLPVLGNGSGEEDTIRVNSFSNRREGLRTLRARHQGQFGIDSQHGTISATDYVAEASFHKQHRNTTKIAKGTESGPVALAATATFQMITNVAVDLDGDNEILTLTSTDGTTRFYRFNNGGGQATGQLIPGTTDAVRVNVAVVASQANFAAELKTAIESPAGHNGKITIATSTTTNPNDTLTFTQAEAGANGNTTMFIAGNSPLSSKFKINGGTDTSSDFTGGVDAPTKRRDNMHFNTPIPASDFQYSWVNAAISGSNWEVNQKVLTYAPRNGVISSSSGIDSAINFPIISDVECKACADSVEFSVSYGSGDIAGTLTQDGGLQVTSSPTSSSQIAPGDAIANMDLTITSNGCCPSTDGFEYRVTAVNADGSGSSYDTGYQTTPQSPPSNIIVDDTGTVIVTFFVKDCEGNIKTLVVRLTNAKLPT